MKNKQTDVKDLKILLFEQQNILETDMLWAFLELGYEGLRIAEVRVPDAEYTEDDVAQILQEMQEDDLVVTKDFSSAVAEACHRASCLYLSWVHDSPQRALYMKEALYETNRVFVFDRAQLERMRKLGIPHVEYMPLGTNVTRVAALHISEQDLKTYGADISFVGNLYDEVDRSYFFEGLSPAVRAEAEQFLRNKSGNWHEGATVYQPLSEQAQEEMFSLISHEGLERYSLPREMLIQLLVFTREIAKRDRIEALTRLSGKYDTRLYTSVPERARKLLPGVDVHGGVDYETEMPKVFHASRINLNLTMPSIETGVPLRIFDIMGAGGFVMSNEQAEIGELFKKDEEIVTFRDFDEMEEKAAYYLSHEEIRKRIALKGWRKVTESYSCKQQVAKMMRQTWM
ncbi:MAG: glycosyltransferase [Lachnospiraceae bacterium]|nr:glycosyltransferase [Lachnospiraceae bacterium]